MSDGGILLRRKRVALWASVFLAVCSLGIILFVIRTMGPLAPGSVGNGLAVASAIVLVLSGLVALFMAAVVRQQKRGNREEKEAHVLDLDFEPKDRISLQTLPFPLLAEAREIWFENVATGTWQGLDVVVFDCMGRAKPRTWLEWLFWSDEIRNRHLRPFGYSCAVTDLPAALPALVLRQTTTLTRLADWVSRSRDVQLGDPHFDRTYVVRTEDESFTRRLLDPNLRRRLLQAGSDCNIEIAGRWILCFRKQGPPERQRVLQQLKAFIDGIPSSVWWERGAQGLEHLPP